MVSPSTEDGINSLAARGDKKAQAGIATIKRTVLQNTVLQGTGRKGWRQILGSAVRQSDQQLDKPLKRLLYSRKKPAAGGFSVSKRGKSNVSEATKGLKERIEKYLKTTLQEGMFTEVSLSNNDIVQKVGAAFGKKVVVFRNNNSDQFDLTRHVFDRTIPRCEDAESRRNLFTIH